ncbi:hypothetical protein AcV7_000907 [Taiwanofungus camphoratus]|nr:hypothetical protein AcV7_000907 [Antrodia cinnamomea]
MRSSIVCFVLSAFLLGRSAALLEKRQSNGCTCGDNFYSRDDIVNAINEAEDGGASDYPHQYKDYEGFSFPSCSKEYYEYPLEQGSVYRGGSPGADRVIYDYYGDFCACITHTGAEGDEFVECDS